LYEAFWDVQPNSPSRKLHLHIYYRFQHTQIDAKIMERLWKRRIEGANWNIKMKNHHLMTDKEFLKAAAELNGDARYWAVAHRYKKMEDASHKGTLYQYTYTKHDWSIVGVGCPKRSTACRRGKCKHHKNKENYWRDI